MRLQMKPSQLVKYQSWIIAHQAKPKTANWKFPKET